MDRAARRSLLSAHAGSAGGGGGGSGGGGGGGGGGGSSSDPTAPRGSYWKRSDSMRLVHVLVEADLKPLFLDQNNNKQFWHQAAQRFNDDNWQVCGQWKSVTRSASRSLARRVGSPGCVCPLFLRLEAKCCSMLYEPRVRARARGQLIMRGC